MVSSKVLNVYEYNRRIESKAANSTWVKFNIKKNLKFDCILAISMKNLVNTCNKDINHDHSIITNVFGSVFLLIKIPTLTAFNFIPISNTLLEIKGLTGVNIYITFRKLSYYDRQKTNTP